jgi:DNA invertase Pin-like site-specific DNA recombinase
MFQMLGLIAEFERSMIRSRVVSGMARARITGTKSGRAIGRPAITDVTRDAICGLLGAGQSERAIVAIVQQQLGVSKGAVGRACGPPWPLRGRQRADPAKRSGRFRATAPV